MLAIQDLVVSYPRAGVVLKRVSLTIRRGEFVVILGRSGAGKSSLLRAINSLVRPSSGSIRVEGIGLVGDRKSLLEHRRRTAMVFQHHHLIARWTALDNVLLGRVGRYSAWRSLFPFSKADVGQALDALDRVELAEHAWRRASELSGGEQQRVGVARSLFQQPQMMLIDEPVASLDPQTADRVMRLLRDICSQERLTALASLHQLDLARRYGDRIIGLADGRIVFDGPPSELTERALGEIYRGAPAPDGGPQGSPAAKEPSLAGLNEQEVFENELLL
jgi:phosphonate transport system ATP-binding protein